jgi:8-oxo-dGTP pyrophosphatase MutT (NUDIX family)
VATGDGDGWVQCRCGARHWGLHGAVGLLLVVHDGAGSPSVLLQLRAGWTHHGGVWGLAGGARDSHESDVEAALREAAEEAGPVAVGARVLATLAGTDHGDWSYRYVLATVDRARTPVPTAESERLTWVRSDEVAALPLIAPLAHDWPALAARMSQLVRPVASRCPPSADGGA